VFRSTKRYGHEVGFSCAFRQWKADSHCNLLHGYALAFKFTFEATELDHRNWVVDFGGLKALKNHLETFFDHKTVVAEDDPYLSELQNLHRLGVLDLVVLPATGCEAFAAHAYVLAMDILKRDGFYPRCRVVEVEVAEHGANSGIFIP
jgi:6-pyruvoyltetrahydropterin/6-carboxytetrahydropterin synthase